MVLNIHIEESTRIRNKIFFKIKRMLYQNPAIRSRVEVYLVEEAKGGLSIALA
jgi:hypothetical protein